MQFADPTFSSAQLKSYFDVSRRQLSYWATTGHIAPSAKPEGIRASVYSLGDVVRIFLVVELIAKGFSTQKSLELESRFHKMAVEKAIRIDDNITVILDKHDRLMIVRGSWWVEENVEIVKYTVPFSKLFEKLAQEGIIP